MPQSPAFLITVLVLNLITDTFILIIPIPIILPLKISWTRKIGILFMFCAGIFIMIAAILRVYFVMAVCMPIETTHLSFAKPSLVRERRDCSYLVMP